MVYIYIDNILTWLYRYKHNNLCHALHKFIAITFKQTCTIDVLLAITNSNPCGKCLSRKLFTITNSNSVAIKKSRNIKIIWILLSISYKSFQHELLYRYILYKYILLVRDICEKYRLRGEANIPSCFSGEGHLTVLETGIFRK